MGKHKKDANYPVYISACHKRHAVFSPLLACFMISCSANLSFGLFTTYSTLLQHNSAVDKCLCLILRNLDIYEFK